MTTMDPTTSPDDHVLVWANPAHEREFPLAFSMATGMYGIWYRRALANGGSAEHCQSTARAAAYDTAMKWGEVAGFSLASRSNFSEGIAELAVRAMAPKVATYRVRPERALEQGHDLEPNDVPGAESTRRWTCRACGATAILVHDAEFGPAQRALCPGGAAPARPLAGRD
jgi:hypothetical protein